MDAIKKYYAPPVVGILAFIVVLLTQPIGHIVMIMTEVLSEKLFHELTYIVATVVGLLGAVLVYIGSKRGPVAATWYGYFGGTLIWSFWVEFSFVFYARDMLDVQPLMAGNEVATLPEYLVMPSSLGLLMATFVFFFLNKDTRCNFFRWFHKNLNMGLGKPNSGKERNISAIVAMETIYVIWFFYVFLLVIYDERLIGEQHPITYMSFFGFVIWSLYLFRRLMMFSRLSSAMRYAIPTAIICWNTIEIAGRWGLLSEFWVEPTKYVTEGIVLGLALVGFTVITMMAPPSRQQVDEVEV